MFGLLLLVMSPCILLHIIEQRRQRRFNMDQIRVQRMSGSLVGMEPPAPMNDQDDGDIQQPLIDPRVMDFENNPNLIRRESVRMRIIQLLQRIEAQNDQNQQIPLENLKRTTYRDPDTILDYDDCPICLETFSLTPNESLIHLPCNKKHLFHEACILEWLKRDKQCPLCRARLTREDILRYQ
mmetsp:Transcript_381/g.355  ORF Transcript_381/g.355 Transcript_381/m.355 type:complete len:182 (+) Transcript_381:449-994(+)